MWLLLLQYSPSRHRKNVAIINSICVAPAFAQPTTLVCSFRSCCVRSSQQNRRGLEKAPLQLLFMYDTHVSPIPIGQRELPHRFFELHRYRFVPYTIYYYNKTSACIKKVRLRQTPHIKKKTVACAKSNAPLRAEHQTSNKNKTEPHLRTSPNSTIQTHKHGNNCTIEFKSVLVCR